MTAGAASGTEAADTGEAFDGRLAPPRGSAPGFRNVTDDIALSLLSAGGWTTPAPSRVESQVLRASNLSECDIRTLGRGDPYPYISDSGLPDLPRSGRSTGGGVTHPSADPGS